VDWRSDAYCLSNWDLRNSGGLYDGGCVAGKRAVGGDDRVTCS
jgi:hypothetical protein